MKNYTLIYTLVTVLCSISFGTLSQTYNLSTSTENYTPISTANPIDKSNPDSLSNSLYTYAVYQGVPIGFDFEFLGETFDSIRMCEDGFAMFWENNVKKGYISMFDCDLKDFSGNSALTPMYYSLEGTVGNRIFKLEVVNAGFTQDPTNTHFAHFQLWLYENCNDFEVRIGSSSTTPNLFWFNTDSPVIGYGSYTSNNKAGLIGDPLNPTLEQTPSTAMDSVPVSGMTYRFSDCSTSTNDISQKPSSIYPNPTTSSVKIELNEFKTYSQLQIQNMQGKIVRSVKVENVSDLHLNIETLSSGVYLFTLLSENGTETHLIRKE